MRDTYARRVIIAVANPLSKKHGEINLPQLFHIQSDIFAKRRVR